MNADRQRGTATRRAVRAPALAAAMLMSLLVACAPRTSEDAAQSVKNLNDQIQALQFINRLQLTTDQAAELTDALKAAEEARSDTQKEEQELLAELVPLLQQNRAFLVKDEPAPPALEAQILQLGEKIRALDALDPQTERTIAQGLRGVLSQDQIAIAAGGLEARIQASEMLDGYRELPPREFEHEIRPFVEELVPDDMDITPDQVEALFREARSLTPEEYTHSKGALVRQLEPLFAPAGTAADHLLVRAFTRPHMIELLTEKTRSAD